MLRRNGMPDELNMFSDMYRDLSFTEKLQRVRSRHEEQGRAVSTVGDQAILLSIFYAKRFPLQENILEKGTRLILVLSSQCPTVSIAVITC